MIIYTKFEITKKIIIDFGTGCTSAEGVVRKGKVLLTYSGNLAFPGSTIITSFEGYEVNVLKLEGTRVLTNTGINLATSTITMTVKVENGNVQLEGEVQWEYQRNSAKTAIENLNLDSKKFTFFYL